jgi:hypothetical protein
MNSTVEIFTNYLARVAPGVLLTVAVLVLTKRSPGLRIVTYLSLFVLLRDAMTPLGLWSFGNQAFFGIRMGTIAHLWWPLAWHGSHFGQRIESEKLISEIKTPFCRAIGALRCPRLRVDPATSVGQHRATDYSQFVRASRSRLSSP